MLRPIISDGVVYTVILTSGSNQIEAWDERSGAPLWTTDVGPFAFSPEFSVSDGVVVVDDYASELHAFSTVDGSELWSSPGGGQYGSLVIANGVVYVTNGQMRALDLHTGNLLWAGPLADDAAQSGPTFWRGEVFQLTGGNGLTHTMHAFDAGDGHELWAAPCANPDGTPNRSPMVLKAVVYDGGCAFDTATGDPVWMFPNSRLSITADATGGQRIFTGVLWGKQQHGLMARFEAVDPATGKVLWHHDYPDPENVSAPFGEGPVVAGGVVYVAHKLNNSHDTIIRAYDARTGHELWHSKTIKHVYSVSIADGRIWGAFWDSHLVRSWSLH